MTTPDPLDQEQQAAWRALDRERRTTDHTEDTE